MAASSDAFKSFKSTGPIVFVDSKKGDLSKAPKEVSRLRSEAHMGNTIPMVMVTTADLTKGLKGINHDDLADAGKAARDLRRELKDVDVVGSAPAADASDVDGDSADSTLLAPQQAWTNADGKTITAAILTADANSVIFLMPDGKSVAYPVAKLSAASKEAVQALLDK